MYIAAISLLQENGFLLDVQILNSLEMNMWRDKANSFRFDTTINSKFLLLEVHDTLIVLFFCMELHLQSINISRVCVNTVAAHSLIS